MDDEPMWVVDRVIALTLGSAITLPATANEFAIKDTKNEVVHLMMFPLSLTGEAKNCEATQEALKAATGAFFLYKTPNQAYQLLKDKDLQSRPKQSTPDHNDDIPMSREEVAKFMQTSCKTRFYNDYRDHNSNRDNWRSSGQNDYNRDNYRSNTNDKPYDIQKQLNDFMKAQQSTNAFVKEQFMDLETQIESVVKNQQASIQYLEAKFDRLADKQSGRPFGSLPNEDPTPQPKTSKPVKEIPTPKSYKLKVPYPQRLRKEKIEAQYGKFLDMIRVVQINVPLVGMLVGMPNYGKFLKELVSNKHKIEQISAAFLSEESSAMIQNKVPPKLGDPVSFLIPCHFNQAFYCNALADLGTSINLMQYSLYAKLSLETLKPTKMSVRLADQSFQYPVGIAKNMLVKVGKFTFPADFVILEMEEDIGNERMIFHIDSAMKHSYSNDDTYFSIDVIDEIIEEDSDALLDERSQIFHSIKGTILEEKLFAEFDEFIAMTADEKPKPETNDKEPEFEKIILNTDYKIKTSLKEPPTDIELKPLPDNLEYVFLEEPSFLPVIISSQLSKENKEKLVYVLKKHKQAFT
ncbi:reverse transcriptase domain-containing protein [Tanacetum coccineum]